MESQLRASIVIPFHSDDVRIFGAIASCLAQTVTDIELLLCDDGAPQEFISRLREIEDPRVRLFVDGKNLGLAGRINESVSLIRSPFYFRMDADDLCVRDRVEVQLRVFEQFPAAMVVAGSCYVVDERDVVIGARDVVDAFAEQPRLSSTAALIHPTVAFRADWLRGHAYDPSLRRTEDRFFWYDNYADSAFRTTSYRLLYYRARSVFGGRMIKAAAREERQQFRKRTGPGIARFGLFFRSLLKQHARVLIEWLGAGDRLRSRTINSLDASELEAANSELADLLLSINP